MMMKIKNITLIFLCSFSIASYATEGTSHIELELSPYDIGRIALNKQNEIKQAQVLSDESDAFTNKITKCAESKKLQRFELVGRVDKPSISKPPKLGFRKAPTQPTSYCPYIPRQ